MSHAGSNPSAIPMGATAQRPLEVVGTSEPARTRTSPGTSGPGPSSIDGFMERASQALLRADYFAVIDLCLLALDRARRAKDFDRLARICMPLQEARRQLRQIACDAGNTRVLSRLPGRDEPMAPGLILLEPPLIGLDGRAVREFARARKVPVLVLAKEPTTSAGLWPVVGVGLGEFENVVVRVRVAPPESLADHKGPLALVDPSRLPGAEWFLRTQEALGDAAIASVRTSEPAAHRVDDLLERLDAVPDHEKLSQALHATAREAITAPAPVRPRRRPMLDDPHSF